MLILITFHCCVLYFMATNDRLLLGQNSFCQRMLSTYGDNYPEPEYIILSARVIKINKKGKQQIRILLLTNKALYNLKENRTYSCQRRINFHIIESISISSISNEFTIHVPTEYDYRYKALNVSEKNRITFLLSKLCNITIHKINSENTRDVTITKYDARQLTIRDRRKQIEFQIENNILKTENIPPCGSFYSQTTMSELNKRIITPIIAKIKHRKTLSLSETYSSPSTPSSASSFLKHINMKDKLLVYGYIRRKAIRKYKLHFPSHIIDYCLLYLCVMFESFDGKNRHQQHDFVEISQNRKTLTIGKSTEEIVYGSYIVNCKRYNNLKTFMWKLRINKISNNSIVYIGIDDKGKDEIIYKAGGFGLLFYIMKGKQNIGRMLCEYERGDYIDVVLDLVDHILVILVNCDKEHVVRNIVVGRKRYRLGVCLSNNTEIELKDFNVFNGSWKQYQESEHMNIEYKTRYFSVDKYKNRNK
eukprot:290769_1